MDKWKGKIAVVTGASVGIGEAIVKDLANKGITVIGLARRPEKIEEYAKDLSEGQIFSYKCDVSDLESIKSAFHWIEEKFGVINILINNAGIGANTTILNDSLEVEEQLTSIINTNFSGLVHVTRSAFRLMNKSNDYGMIVNINSVAGHKVPFMKEGQSSNVYNGTKYAVTATTEVLRQELIHMKKEKIRISSVSPGVVETDFFTAAKYIPEGQKMGDYMPALTPSDVSDAVLYLLSTPYHVNITEMTIRPNLESF